MRSHNWPIAHSQSAFKIFEMKTPATYCATGFVSTSPLRPFSPIRYSIRNPSPDEASVYVTALNSPFWVLCPFPGYTMCIPRPFFFSKNQTRYHENTFSVFVTITRYSCLSFNASTANVQSRDRSLRRAYGAITHVLLP